MIPPVVILRSARQRDLLRRAADELPADTVVRFAGSKRSDAQNARMWAMIADVAKAQPDGRVHDAETWKAIFCHALGKECRFERTLDGATMFPIGYRTSQLTVREMSDLMEVIAEYGSRHGVVWTNEGE